ncbi:reverse transcriptase [Lasius niger]|uniref:Reverse transcriptase n=1 Tax=Lasius niger TaxID=67767 RepID=A0A0J7KH07_LASNI|nr:reverse transcriptase [Lasius niger]
MQTVRELKPDLLIISEPYRRLSAQPWVSDYTGKAVIWSCGEFPFQDVVDSTEMGFVRAKLGNIHFYSCYAPSSLTFDEFTDFLDRLVKDAKEHFPVAIAGDFNAWAVDWGSKETNPRG